MILLIVMLLTLVYVGVHTYLHSCWRYERMQRSFEDDNFGRQWQAYFDFFDELNKNEFNYWQIWKVRR